MVKTVVLVAAWRRKEGRHCSEKRTETEKIAFGKVLNDDILIVMMFQKSQLTGEDKIGASIVVAFFKKDVTREKLCSFRKKREEFQCLAGKLAKKRNLPVKVPGSAAFQGLGCFLP